MNASALDAILTAFVNALQAGVMTLSALSIPLLLVFATMAWYTQMGPLVASGSLSPGDALLVWGPTGAVSTTINATLVKDQSIQRAFTRLVGTIGGVNGSIVTTTVTADPSGARAPFGRGQDSSSRRPAGSARAPRSRGAAVRAFSGCVARRITCGKLDSRPLIRQSRAFVMPSVAAAAI